MDDNQNTDESAFIPDDVSRMIEEIVDAQFHNVPYDETKVPSWINLICERVMKGLADSGKPYKYMVNCIIMQKNGAPMMTTWSCFWDTVLDGSAYYRWPKEKSKDNVNKTMDILSLIHI
eukprot:TRINITY_DN7625_c0_g1_i12.p1 TRINITY_DN7625_c0_g1~~TRINITY_DN7625_c0_g1_i12.p1  ORF type:complete len:119 (-),score=5.17 TRINITY_DN7625_c0_g1_i12:62-418(-)